jgi:hypothetical protein
MTELETVVERGITLRINPLERTAQVRVHVPGRADELVEVARAEDGWFVCRDGLGVAPGDVVGSFDAALGEALAAAADLLEQRVLEQLRWWAREWETARR